MHLERIDVEMREEEGRTAFDKMIVREGGGSSDIRVVPREIN